MSNTHRAHTPTENLRLESGWAFVSGARTAGTLPFATTTCRRWFGYSKLLPWRSRPCLVRTPSVHALSMWLGWCCVCVRVCVCVCVCVCVWSGVEWSGVEWSGVEWSGVECCAAVGVYMYHRLTPACLPHLSTLERCPSLQVELSGNTIGHSDREQQSGFLLLCVCAICLAVGRGLLTGDVGRDTCAGSDLLLGGIRCYVLGCSRFVHALRGRGAAWSACAVLVLL